MKSYITNEGVTVITPSENKYLTDGNGNYSDCVYLAASANPDDWYEVDEIPPEPVPEDEEDATEEDYLAALNELGVQMDEEEYQIWLENTLKIFNVEIDEYLY